MTRAILLGSTPDAAGPMAWFALAAACGVGTARLQRPSIRAGLGARHPMLYAPCDDRWKAQRPRPPLYHRLLRRPGIFPGRRHQHQGLGVPLHQKSAYATLRIAPSGKTPVARKRPKAMRNWRATATIPMTPRRRQASLPLARYIPAPQKERPSVASGRSPELRWPSTYFTRWKVAV